MSDDAVTPFDRFQTLPSPLIMTALQVMKFCGHYRQLEPESTYDWSGFRKAVIEYQGRNLFTITLPNDKIHLQAADVSSMVEQIVNSMKDELNVAVSAIDMDALRSAVAASSDKRQCEYYIMFASRQPGTDEVFFFSLVTTIELGRTALGFYGVIDAMKLLVVKGFKDPTR
ncbi:hypothetical protein OE88DRAFT_1646281 [Heliocybe sulcata]|uniref:Uncharacterized protein n=1 Tax=Heliocybe sulcata TaxID=5364 RepID=A0A5C3MV50_9AGAM|nr:hypothetical protein OE88DRAFT_1646281 [Heliocybe sulcata]